VTRVLLVGLGTIARTHASVLAQRDDVDLVGGVDPRPSDWFTASQWRSLDEAFSAAGEPDLVVIATPTPTHVDLVEHLLAATDARVLCEKPLAATPAELDRLTSSYDVEVLGSRLAVAHHFAFSPEVEWARARALAEPGWGEPTRILSVFNDAYGRLPAARLDSLVSSWVDSGPNQLSIVAAFTPDADWSVDSHTAQREHAVTVLDGGRTTLTSNWLAADSSKQTIVEYAGHTLRLDHTSVTALHLANGEVVEQIGYTGTASRKDAHYLGVYDAVLTRPADPRLGLPLARQIADALNAATQIRADQPNPPLA
jgi:predicted dehydrogenase